MNTTTRRLGSAALALLMIGGLTATSPASAKDGDGRVIVRGDCSSRSDWRLRRSPTTAHRSRVRSGYQPERTPLDVHAAL